MRRRFLSLVAGAALLLPATLTPMSAAAGTAAQPAQSLAAAPAEEVVATPFQSIAGAPNPAVPDGYEQVAETASMRLYISRADSKLIVEDKRSGKLWSSNPLTPLSDQKSILDDALFLLNFTNARKQMTNLTSSANDKPDLSFQSIPNGVRVVYDIRKLLIKITIDYALKEDPALEGNRTIPYLEVTIPDSGITEAGDCSVATSTNCSLIQSIEVLPLFGAAPVGDQGYLMIPDGSGAIVNFKPEYPQYRQRYSSPIYGSDAGQQVFTGDRRNMQGDRFPRMPIWGLKDGPDAYAGVVTKGEYQANINAYLAGYITNANRASTEFVFRRQASIPRRRTLFVNRIEDTRLPGDRQVRYVLLTGGDANYAGMAKAYRDYLMKERGIKRLGKEAPRPLLELYMGLTRRASFRDDFLTMTTFDQGIDIMKAFLDKGLQNFDVVLQGWNSAGRRGDWPRRYPADPSLGGNAGLRRIIDFAHKNGIRIILDDNYWYGYTISSGGIFGQIPYVRNIWPNWSYGFNTRFDTMRGVNKLPVFSGSNFNTSLGFYLINPVIARTRYADRDLPKHKSFGADGVILERFGSLASSDTNDRYPLSRQEAVQEWMKISDKARDLLGHAMIQGSNDYVVGHTERIYDAPVDSTDAFGDTPVPIYHIALNGLVTRTTIWDNLRNDPRTEFLRQIEWDMQPDYYLSYAPSSSAIRVQFEQLYSGQYTEWLDPAAKEYKQMHDEFGALNSLFITAHDILANRVNRVTYEDGTQLIVNYNPTPYDGPEGHVDAYGYVMRKGGSR